MAKIESITKKFENVASKLEVMFKQGNKKKKNRNITYSIWSR